MVTKTYRVQSGGRQSGEGVQWTFGRFPIEPRETQIIQLRESYLSERVVAICRRPDGAQQQTIIGSGFMIAPGLLVTATHVIRELAGHESKALAQLPDEQVRLWHLFDAEAFRHAFEAIPILGIEHDVVSDVSLVACELDSEAFIHHPLLIPAVEIAEPRVGETLFAVGFRQTNAVDEGIPEIALLLSSGPITAVHLDGRGKVDSTPTLEVDMPTVGGMSGGPVFNERGNVVGLVSRSLSADGEFSPTNVSLIWSAMLAKVKPKWPDHLWSASAAMLDDMPTLVVAKQLGFAAIDGDVTSSPIGDWQISFSR